MDPALKVVLISRLSTQNAGNEGLSIEFISLMRELLPHAELRAIDRYPAYFARLRMAHLGAELAHVPAKFDDLVRQLSVLGTGSRLSPLADANLVRLNPSGRELPRWLARIKRFVAIRRRLAQLGALGRSHARASIVTVRRADVVLWNPAGEIHPTGSRDEVLRLLILVRMAQMEGARTLIVNHSLEIADQTLRVLLSHVYRQASQVCVRDRVSLQKALEIGVDVRRLHEVPDLVFLAATSAQRVLPPAKENFPPGAIGIAVNGNEASLADPGWAALFDGLRRLGRPLVFVSNAMNHDMPLALQLQAAYGVKVVERQPSYRELRGFYAGLSVLVSSRLHASILSLCEGVPVVSIEPSQFKMTAIFEQLGYPLRTLHTATAGWPQQALANVNRALSPAEGLSDTGRDAARRQSDEVRRAYRKLLTQSAATTAQRAPLLTVGCGAALGSGSRA